MRYHRKYKYNVTDHMMTGSCDSIGNIITIYVTDHMMTRSCDTIRNINAICDRSHDDQVM